MNLNTIEGTFVLNSQRKIGFLVDFESKLGIYKDFIVTKRLKLPLYKCSQDPIELFNNNNPTARQLMSAYKKILIHAEIRDGGVGNCIPLDQINILNIDSNKKNPEDIINEENVIYGNIDTNDNYDFSLSDHDYALDVNYLFEFTAEVLIYIAGFVVKKINKKLNCENSINVPFGFKEDMFNSFLNFKSIG